MLCCISKTHAAWNCIPPSFLSLTMFQKNFLELLKHTGEAALVAMCTPVYCTVSPESSPSSSLPLVITGGPAVSNDVVCCLNNSCPHRQVPAKYSLWVCGFGYLGGFHYADTWLSWKIEPICIFISNSIWEDLITFFNTDLCDFLNLFTSYFTLVTRKWFPAFN